MVQPYFFKLSQPKTEPNLCATYSELKKANTIYEGLSKHQLVTMLQQDYASLTTKTDIDFTKRGYQYLPLHDIFVLSETSKGAMSVLAHKSLQPHWAKRFEKKRGDLAFNADGNTNSLNHITALYLHNVYKAQWVDTNNTNHSEANILKKEMEKRGIRVPTLLEYALQILSTTSTFSIA